MSHSPRKIIRIDENLCDGCGNCIVDCAEGALAVVDGKARLVGAALCDGLGACLGRCPTGALEIVEALAEPFAGSPAEPLGRSVPSGCPGGGSEGLAPAAAASSRLGHWPVQLRLVPPEASFLRGARLLLTADCVPPALPDFNARFLSGRVLLLGCPKFDDARAQVEKFSAILAANAVREVTVLRMEVPCCAGLNGVAERAMRAAGCTAPLGTIVVGRDGRVSGSPPRRVTGIGCIGRMPA